MYLEFQITYYANIDQVICKRCKSQKYLPKLTLCMYMQVICNLISDITEKTHAIPYLNYWTTLCAFMIWLPLMIMLTSFVFIYQKLSKSTKAFPYLSVQSKVARSRKKVIGMLLILIIIEIICWAPWMLWIIFQYINYITSDKSQVKNQKVI